MSLLEETANSQCQRRRRRRRLFRRLYHHLCLLLAPCATCLWTTNRQTRSDPRARIALPARLSRKRWHRPWCIAPSTGWRSTGGRTGHSQGTTRSAAQRRLAPQRVVLPNAARRPAQGSICLGLGLGVPPSALAPPAIAANYAHQTLGALCAQGLLGQARGVLR